MFVDAFTCWSCIACTVYNLPDATHHVPSSLSTSSRLASSVFVDFGESFTCRDKVGRRVHVAGLAARCGHDDNGEHDW